MMDDTQDESEKCLSFDNLQKLLGKDVKNLCIVCESQNSLCIVNSES